MANPVQPQAVQQEPQAQVEQPQEQQRYFLGDMSDQQIRVLQAQCIDQHNENGALIGTLLGVASIVAGIFTAYVVTGLSGAFLGFATFLVLGKIFSLGYHGMRNQDLIEAARALEAMNFREYIVLNRLDLSKDTIVQVHQQYKQHLAAQVQDLRA